MDAFESLAATLFTLDGYWVRNSFKVNLTKAEKRRIGRPSAPRWELDLVAYKAQTNEVLAVECKSYLDSVGVTYKSMVGSGTTTLKLFREKTLRDVVLNRLYRDLLADGLCRKGAKPRLCLLAARIPTERDREQLHQLFDENGWRLFDPPWIIEKLRKYADEGYDNQVAAVVTKLIMRNLDLLRPQ